MKTLVQTQNPLAPARVEQEPTAWLLAPVNIFETNDGYVLEAEMPGVNKKGLEITLEGNELTITGHRDDAPTAGLLYRESKPAGFRRSFELDPAIDASKISAHLDQGLLTLRLPKADQIKPRKINVS